MFADLFMLRLTKCFVFLFLVVMRTGQSVALCTKHAKGVILQLTYEAQFKAFAICFHCCYCKRKRLMQLLYYWRALS